LLIDHGSRREAANAMLHEVAALVEHVAGGGVIVVPAHMELAEPSIASGFAACVARGATEVIAVPYMLSPGRHSTEDIPALVAQAAARHTVPYSVAKALGVHRALAEVVLERAGIAGAAVYAGVYTTVSATHATYQTPYTTRYEHAETPRA
jgi:sirohydrochlorin ferrochelatase